MQGILKDIVENKRREVEQAKKQTSLASLKAMCADRPHTKDFFIALASSPQAAIIAECKKRSPSKGALCEDYDPLSLATQYERAGAAAISVLTDQVFFGGQLSDLEAVAQAVEIPVLRKDFIVDEYQIFEAHRYGASSFLLLASLHDAIVLQYLVEVGRDLGMEALVEVHSAAELKEALRTDAKIIGVNSRDLRTMKVDASQALTMLSQLSEAERNARLFVFESGVSTQQDVSQGRNHGFKAFLVGETLMRSHDVAATMHDLLGGGK